MSDQKSTPLLTEQQAAAMMTLGTPLLEGFENAFLAESNWLQRVETMTVDILHRQRASCAAMLQLIGRLRTARDPAELLRAQQDWLNGAAQRLVADATCWWPAAGAALLEGVGGSARQTVPPAKPDAAQVQPARVGIQAQERPRPG